MKSVAAAIVIALIILGGGIFFSNYIDGITEKCIKLNDEIFQLAENGDFSPAEERVKALEELVEENTGILSSVINHESVDDIEGSIAVLKVNLCENNRSGTLISSASLDTALKNLPQNYKLKIENIF